MALGKWTLLLVAVDPRLTSAMQRLIERRGLADVFIARDAESARELLAGLHFDAVIVDVDLPYGRGHHLLVEVAVGHPGTRRVAIGRASRRGLRTMVDAGLVHDAVAKPVDLHELLEALGQVATPRMPVGMGVPSSAIFGDHTPLPS